MKITDIKIRRIFTEGNIRALVSITIENEFAVHDIKVINGNERLFVAMPSRKGNDGTFRDIAHPISSDVREQIEKAILQVYNEYLETYQAEEQSQ